VTSFTVATTCREEFIQITSQVDAIVRTSGMTEGLCLVFCPHTTAGLTVNECADPDVATDLQSALAGWVPESGGWRHVEGNSAAHVKASLVGASVAIPVENGKLKLGTWQGILLCEFDGPRIRDVWVQTAS
jgi:secondary thiamine-phosphate synthase enzyme